MPNKLRILSRAVALEAFSVSDVTTYFKGIFPSIQHSFTDFVSRFNPTIQGLAVTGKARDFHRDLSKHPYTDIGLITAFTPEGLSVHFREYADVLEMAVDHATKLMDVLNPYSVYLAQLVSNHEQQLGTKTDEAAFKVLEKERDLINGDLGNCFRKGSTQVESTINKVVQRNSDWADIIAKCELMTKKINMIDRSKVIKKIDECSEHLGTIMKKINRGDLDKISSATVLNLAEGAFQMASELEFYSVAYFKLEVFVTCVNKTIDHFVKVTTPVKS